MFYSHIICLGTKIVLVVVTEWNRFYSHIICLGTKIWRQKQWEIMQFYSHIICLGTKIKAYRKDFTVCFTVT